MGFEDDCSTGLGLGLGLGRHESTGSDQSDHHQERKKKQQQQQQLYLKYDNCLPYLRLGPSEDHHQSGNLHRQASSLTAVSSFSNSSIKKEREVFSGEVEVEVEEEVDHVDVQVERVFYSRASDEDEEGNSRKKLRLTKQQAVILEASFKQHATLNPRQKQVLAKQLNLRPRQVEVWFQNRRARTKLKQTEVECELLRKRCEALTEENQRLQKELQELKALKLATPFYMQLPAATLTMCPSCERVANGNRNAGGDAPPPPPPKGPFTLGAKPRFSNPITHPSPAC